MTNINIGEKNFRVIKKYVDKWLINVWQIFFMAEAWLYCQFPFHKVDIGVEEMGIEGVLNTPQVTR